MSAPDDEDFSPEEVRAAAELAERLENPENVSSDSPDFMGRLAQMSLSALSEDNFALGRRDVVAHASKVLSREGSAETVAKNPILRWLYFAVPTFAALGAFFVLRTVQKEQYEPPASASQAESMRAQPQELAFSREEETTADKDQALTGVSTRALSMELASAQMEALQARQGGTSSARADARMHQAEAALRSRLLSELEQK